MTDATAIAHPFWVAVGACMTIAGVWVSENTSSERTGIAIAAIGIFFFICGVNWT